MSNTAKNILILAMSTLNDRLKENYYRHEGSISYECSGVSQLEPITKLVIDNLNEMNERLDVIIVLNTSMTENKTYEKKNCANYLSDLSMGEESEKISAFEFYQERIKDWLNKKSIESKSLTDFDLLTIESVVIDEFHPKEGVAEAVKKVIDNYRIDEQKKSKLFIDTQGGFRDIVFVMTSVIKMLKIRNIIPDHIYSINFKGNNTKDSPCTIDDKTNNYNIIDLASGMDEFINYGKCKLLKKYYEKNEDAGIKKVLKAVQIISDAIALSNPNTFESGIKALMESVDGYKNADPFFDLFVSDVKNEYCGLLTETSTNGEKKLDYVETVKWCLKKEFYQQALTFVENKFTKLFVERKYVYYTDYLNNKGSIENEWKTVETEFWDMVCSKAVTTKDAKNAKMKIKGAIERNKKDSNSIVNRISKCTFGTDASTISGRKNIIDCITNTFDNCNLSNINQIIDKMNHIQGLERSDIEKLHHCLESDNPYERFLKLIGLLSGSFNDDFLREYKEKKSCKLNQWVFKQDLFIEQLFKQISSKKKTNINASEDLSYGEKYQYVSFVEVFRKKDKAKMIDGKYTSYFTGSNENNGYNICTQIKEKEYDKLDTVVILYHWIKELRNGSNHGNPKQDIPIEEIVKVINHFLDKFNELENCKLSL